MIHVKILSYKSPQRFAVKRTLLAAKKELCKLHPEVELAISEVVSLPDIEEYTATVIFPSLVVNEKLVCVGRFPKKNEVIAWLEETFVKDGKSL